MLSQDWREHRLAGSENSSDVLSEQRLIRKFEKVKLSVLTSLQLFDISHRECERRLSWRGMMSMLRKSGARRRRKESAVDIKLNQL